MGNPPGRWTPWVLDTRMAKKKGPGRPEPEVLQKDISESSPSWTAWPMPSPALRALTLHCASQGINVSKCDVPARRPVCARRRSGFGQCAACLQAPPRFDDSSVTVHESWSPFSAGSDSIERIGRYSVDFRPSHSTTRVGFVVGESPRHSKRSRARSSIR